MNTDGHGLKARTRAKEPAAVVTKSVKRAGTGREQCFSLFLSVFIRVHPWFNWSLELQGHPDDHPAQDVADFEILLYACLPAVMAFDAAWNGCTVGIDSSEIAAAA